MKRHVRTPCAATPPWQIGRPSVPDDRFVQMEKRIVALETRGAVDDVHRDNVAVRLGKIEDTLKWLVRLVIGGLLMSAIAFVIQGGFNP